MLGPLDAVHGVRVQAAGGAVLTGRQPVPHGQRSVGPGLPGKAEVVVTRSCFLPVTTRSASTAGRLTRSRLRSVEWMSPATGLKVAGRMSAG